MIPNLLRQVTNSFLFHPVRGQDRTPAALGMEFEELRITADDGVQTQAWWIPHRGDSPLGVAVLTFHGNAGTMADRLEHTRLLHGLGVDVLTAEYRGYGDSGGSPSEEGLAADARAAMARLTELAPGRRLVVHGRSLGGAVAIRLASETAPAGLIVESTFTSLRDMAARSGIPLATTLIAYRFDSVAAIADVDAPVFIVHGDADEMIPPTMGRHLEAAAGGPVEYLAVPAGTHNDTWLRAGDAYWTRLRRWLVAIASSP